MTDLTQPPRAESIGRPPIASLASLREHLQWAIELEHATIPPYLCALYSLDPRRNAEAYDVVVSVMMEEMLHMTLAANLLNAVGGSPVVDAPHMLPGYPAPLPHGDRSFEVSLLPFGKEALELFLRIEEPAAPEAPAESDDYETIGQFYAAIELGLRELCMQLGEDAVFSGDPARQVTSDAVYRGSGEIIAVTDLSTALKALAEIVEQGEGTAHRDIWDGDHEMSHPDRPEVAHYYRFQELLAGRRFQPGDTPKTGPTGGPVTVEWDEIYPMRPNPRIADNDPGNPVREAQEKFNSAYCDLLHRLERAFNGDPQLLGAATAAMYGLKAQAIALLQTPLPSGTETAGPTFEYVDPAERR